MNYYNLFEECFFPKTDLLLELLVITGEDPYGLHQKRDFVKPGRDRLSQGGGRPSVYTDPVNQRKIAPVPYGTPGGVRRESDKSNQKP